VQRDAAAMKSYLTTITTSLEAMQGLLSRMGERCDPYVYYKRVRVPMSGEFRASWWEIFKKRQLSHS
jgi:indoleamine 2,3-dioxygenase